MAIGLYMLANIIDYLLVVAYSNFTQPFITTLAGAFISLVRFQLYI